MTTPVSFIKPLVIKESMITSSTAVTKLASEQEWVATTNYALGTIVTRAEVGGRRFENLIPGTNSNKPEEDRARWYEHGLTDKMTMFDSSSARQSIAASTLTVIFRPGAFNAMYLAGLDGTSLNVTIKDAPGGTAFYAYSGSLEDSAPDNYYDWAWAPFVPQTDFLVTGLPPYANCEVTISITKPTGVARCAIVSLGDLTAVGGPALSGVTVEIEGSASVKTDARGQTEVKLGKLACDLTASAIVPSDIARSVVRALRSVQNTPCPWLITDQRLREELRSFGLGSGKLTYLSNRISLDLDIQGTI